jgi:heterotetrameric sarcosine oxidase gamma subunit
VVDVSAQRTTLRLRGEHARDLLAGGCSLDLHPRVFGTRYRRRRRCSARPASC